VSRKAFRPEDKRGLLALRTLAALRHRKWQSFIPCVAGARYSDAEKSYQETGSVGVVVASGEHELDELFLDWHDKTHAALAKAGIQL
jgi:hypothetical protein